MKNVLAALIVATLASGCVKIEKGTMAPSSISEQTVLVPSHVVSPLGSTVGILD